MVNFACWDFRFLFAICMFVFCVFVCFLCICCFCVLFYSISFLYVLIDVFYWFDFYLSLFLLSVLLFPLCTVPDCNLLFCCVFLIFWEQFGAQLFSAFVLRGLSCTMQSRGFTGEIHYKFLMIFMLKYHLKFWWLVIYKPFYLAIVYNDNKYIIYI